MFVDWANAGPERPARTIAKTTNPRSAGRTDIGLPRKRPPRGNRRRLEMESRSPSESTTRRSCHHPGHQHARDPADPPGRRRRHRRVEIDDRVGQLAASTCSPCRGCSTRPGRVRRRSGSASPARSRWRMTDPVRRRARDDDLGKIDRVPDVAVLQELADLVHDHRRRSSPRLRGRRAEVGQRRHPRMVLRAGGRKVGDVGADVAARRAPPRARRRPRCLRARS